MRSKFDEQLNLLHNNLILMGALCENAIALSAKALTEGNLKTAAKVPELSAQIKQKERDIEGMCMRLLLQQQPVAKDLRVVSSALKMVTDMERIGDNSGDIAEIIIKGNVSLCDDTLNIREIALATIKMVTDSIDAFVKQDLKLAEQVIDYDDVVDGQFDRIKHELIDRLKKSDANGELVLDILMISKYFERIGDHAVNIAQWVRFSIAGEK